jgi:hypothetical protein
MQELQIALRIVHILAGVAWVGIVGFFVLFLMPTAAALGGQATPVMVHINKRLHLTVVIPIVAILNIVAGLILYWRTSRGLDLEWITSPSGLGFTVGGLSAIVAFAIGATVVRHAADRMEELGETLLSAGRPPTPEEGAEIGVLLGKLRVWGRVVLALLTLTVIAMASSQLLF